MSGAQGGKNLLPSPRRAIGLDPDPLGRGAGRWLAGGGKGRVGEQSSGRVVGSPTVLSFDKDMGEKKTEGGGDKEEDLLSPMSEEEVKRISKCAREAKARALERPGPSNPGPRVLEDKALGFRVRLVTGSKKRKMASSSSTEREEEGGEGETELVERSGATPVPPSLQEKRSRGRPPKSPSRKGQFTWEKMEERRKARELKKLEETAAKIENPKIRATSARAESMERKALMILDRLREVSTPELTDAGLREVEIIKKVASSSTNMSGAFVGLLWRAAEKLLALNMAFTERVGTLQIGEGRDKAEEVERLRAEVSNSRTENALLRGQVRELRERVEKGVQEVAGPSKPRRKTSPVARRVRKGGKKVSYFSDTSMNTEEEVELDKVLTRDLSPDSREIGEQARREVRKDLEEGTIPVAVRPPLRGKTVRLEGVASQGLHPAKSFLASRDYGVPTTGGPGPLAGEVAKLVAASLGQLGLIPQGGRHRELALGGSVPLAGGVAGLAATPPGQPGMDLFTQWGGQGDLAPCGSGPLAGGAAADGASPLGQQGLVPSNQRKEPFRGTDWFSERGAEGEMSPSVPVHDLSSRKRERRNPVGRDSSLPAPTATQTEGGKKGKKKKKRKRNRGKGGGGGEVSQQGTQGGPKGTAPQPPTNSTRPTAPSREKSSTSLDQTMLSEGEHPRQPQPLWTEVVRKGRKGGPKGADQSKEGGNPSPPSGGKGETGPKGAARGAVKPQVPKGPRWAAVTVTCPEGRYAEVMKEARANIKLEDLGISGMRTRRGVTGALVLEIPGQDGAEKAELLCSKMKEILDGKEGVWITRPVKKTEVRIRDLDDSITQAELREAIAGAAGGVCRPEDILTGPVRRDGTRMGTSWVRCPIAAARKIAAMGRIPVGWSTARVQVLAARPLQCYRCLEGGHVRADCTSEVDRSGRCYRCGSLGHRAGDCRSPVSCPLCKEAGRPADHRVASGACPGSGKKKGGRKGKNKKSGSVPPPPTPWRGVRPPIAPETP